MAKRKILLIDDDRDVVDSTARLFRSEGVEIIRAYGGAEGLQKVTEEHPDLVLLDVAMRDVDGYEVLTKIRDRGIPTRVVIFTGYATSLGDVVKFIKAGACDYLIKGHSSSTDVVNGVERALAVDTTINLRVCDTTPIIEQLIAASEKLGRDNEQLQAQNSTLLKQDNRTSFIMIAARLLCLLISMGLTALLASYGFVSKAGVFILPVILFALLVLPFERIKKLRLKAPAAEGEIEM